MRAAPGPGTAESRGASRAALRLRPGGDGKAGAEERLWFRGRTSHRERGCQGRGMCAPTSQGGRDVRCTPRRGLSPLPSVPGALWEPPAELRVGAHAAPKAEVMAKLVPGLPAPPGTVWGQTGLGGYGAPRGGIDEPQP